MNKEFYKNGYVVLKDTLNFETAELKEIEKYISENKNKNFGQNGVLKILSWEDTEISNKILNKIVSSIQSNIDFDKKKLLNKFTKKVYYTEDNINTSNRNQLLHFDSYPKLKAFIYLSDNSESGSGSISFASGSHKSWFMTFINFLRFFYVPGKHGVQNILFYHYFIKKLSSIEANGKQYSLVIFNTDTLHKASKIEKKNFIRKTIRFDFGVYKYPRSILEKLKK